MAAAGVAAALSILLTGCGGSDSPKPAPAASDDQRQILATIDALQSASIGNDAAKICREIFAPALAKSIRDTSNHSCEAEVRDSLTSPDAQFSVARKIDINGSRATTTIREQNGNMSTVGLVKTAGGWRIERVTPAKTP
jgi:hypothetical protein